jgi:nitric oxide reductase subunit B
LLSFIIDIIKERYGELIPERRMIHTGFWITNLSLLVFWVSLITAGVIKAKWQMSADRTPFAEMMVHLKPVFGIFAISGASLLLGMFMVVIPLMKRLVTGYIAVKE